MIGGQVAVGRTYTEIFKRRSYSRATTSPQHSGTAERAKQGDVPLCAPRRDETVAFRFGEWHHESPVMTERYDAVAHSEPDLAAVARAFLDRRGFDGWSIEAEIGDGVHGSETELRLSHAASHGLAFVDFAPESLAAALEKCPEFRIVADVPELVHPNVVLEVRAIVEHHAWGRDETKSIARLLEGNGLLTTAEADWLIAMRQP